MSGSQEPSILLEAEAVRRAVQLRTAFTPSAPVQRKELFAPRIKQVTKVIGAVTQVGQHVILYGERGVGKTSLASLIYDFLNEALLDSSLIAPRVNCDGGDDYAKVWAKVADQVGTIYARRNIDLPKLNTPLGKAHQHLCSNVAEPDIVRHYLELNGGPMIIIIDEFDRVTSIETRTAFADTIKMLSDHGVSATLVLVGVADTIDQLISEHASIHRNIVQVKMPRMDRDELGDVVRRGLAKAGMTITADALSWITDIARGLPHYAHLLGLHSAMHAVEAGPTRSEVKTDDVDHALEVALEDVQETIRTVYTRATSTAHRGHIYKQVLLAAAVSPVDDLGYFAPVDVRQPLSRIMRKRYDIPAFIPHLNRLCTEAKGCVLEMTGADRRHRFRFRDPLMAPYLTMRGLNEGMLQRGQLRQDLSTETQRTSFQV